MSTFQQFWLYYSIPKLGMKKHSSTGDNLWSHLTLLLRLELMGWKYLNLPLNLVWYPKNLCHGRIHRKAIPSLLHFLFIIGPLGSEIRQDGLIYACNVKMRYKTSLSAKVMLILLPRPWWFSCTIHLL